MVAGWLQGLYLFATIVGIGVTAVDMLGILGDGTEHGGGNGGDHDGVAHEGGPHGSHAPLVSMVRYLRMAVYFSLGFGPLGLVAQATGSAGMGSLLWAVPGGMAAAWLARAFFRFQQRDLDSTVRDEDLLFERARVIVPLSRTVMGKVRVKLGQAIVERYALAEDDEDSFRTDEVVEIVRVEDDCVYVRRSEGKFFLDQLS
jgi:membrane protein implicated in regulation of membrane protease activity